PIVLSSRVTYTNFMRIMSLNGWGGTLADQLLPYLAATDPDVLCLQEVVHSPDTSLAELEYRDGTHILPQRANFFADVCAALPHHTATFCPAARGVLWDGDAAVPSYWGLATFVRSTIPVIAQNQGFVHKGYGADGYGDHPRSRSAHGLRLWDHTARHAVSVTHMHGLRDLRGKMDTPERARQAERLLALSASVTEAGDIAVICGDFNVTPESETLKLLTQAGFTELVTHFGHPTTRTSHYRKPARFADYLAVNDISAVKQFDVVTAPEVSDHCPLVVTLT
ncbi:MAG: endonuclease/exonuclease/phosphatase family protein, partial [Pseudomonadota bacterium]